MTYSETLYNALDIDIDKYINPYLPHNLVRRLPKPVSHFLGYRTNQATEPPALVQWTLTIFATVAGICLVGGVYNFAPGIQKWHPPPIVASLGASAILDYNAVRSPLAQPRNAIVGHTLAAIVGTGISKAFQLTPDIFTNYSWVAGAVACAGASLAMSMTRTVHPPGGATAILACTQKQVIGLGWMFPPFILLASVLMTTVACIFNNTLRQYPVYWWTPDDVGHKLPRRAKTEAEPKDVEEGDGLKKVETSQTSNSERTLAHRLSNEVELVEGLDEIHILPYKARLPSHIDLSEEEVAVLEQLQARLRLHAEVN